MTCLDFIAKVIDSLVWPITAIVGLFVLKPILENILQRIKSIRYREFAADIESSLDEVSELSGSISSNIQSEEENAQYEHFARLAKYSTSAAITEVWKLVEFESIGVLGDTFDLRRLSGFRLEQELFDRKLLDANMVGAMRELRYIRNQAAHFYDFEIPLDQALKFVVTALGIAYSLRAKKSENTNNNNAE